MVRYGFHFNGARCTGCKTCMMACADYNDLPSDIAFRQVYEYGGGGWKQDADGAWSSDCFAYYISISCNHCADPACVKVCPTGAMHQDGMNLVSVNSKMCIGCGYCAFSCPYRAPKVNRAQGYSAKCDACKSRLNEGLQPVCVEACPVRALDFGDVIELNNKYGSTSAIPPLPAASATKPNLVITVPKDFDHGDINGELLNQNEII